MNLKDFATSLVAIAPVPASSGTTLAVTTGEGVRFPSITLDKPFFYVTACPLSEFPTLDNAEKLKVIDVTDDVFTIERAQGDTTARVIEAGWIISNCIYTDDLIEKPEISVDGDIVTFDGITGRVIAGGGKKISDLPHYSNGSCQISSITDNGDGSITLGDGDYCLSNNTAGSDFITQYTVTGGVFSLTDLAMNYIVANYNGGTPVIQNISDVTLINETTIVPIYSVFRNGNFLHIQNWDSLANSLSNKIHQSIVKTQRYRRESGLTLSEYGTRNINCSNGIVWVGAVPISLAAIATATDNIFFWYHVAGVWTSSVITQYNNTQYDNGTNLATLGITRYAVNWVFRGVESQKHLYVVLGGGDYTLAQAEASSVPALPISISSHATLVGRIIVANGAATATLIQSAFNQTFSSNPTSVHGDLTGRDAADQHPAASITNTPYGALAATNVQTAINELEDEKQPNLGYTAENVANKDTTVTLGTSDTKYPSQKAVKTYVDSLTNETQARGETPSGVIDGVNVTFTLAATPAPNSERLYKNGIRLRSGVGNDYTIAGNVITMATAPVTTPVLSILLIDYEISVGTFAQGVSHTIPNETPSGVIDSVNKVFTTAFSYMPGTLKVWRRGLLEVNGVHFFETDPGSGIFTYSDSPDGGTDPDNHIVEYQHLLSSVGDAATLNGVPVNTTPVANTLLPLNNNSKLPGVILGTSRLNSTETTDFANGIPLTVNTWTDLRSNQNFTVGSSDSIILISVGGSAIIGGAGTPFASSRVVVDSGGTPIIRSLGGMFVVAGGQYANPFSGNGIILLSGLSAGVHTIKTQVLSTVAGNSAYCRCLTIPNSEFFNTTVLEIGG